ncbi:hypothetical protein [Buchananella hordeovulneris]|uniref:hypothetical protein n=1 Tax=Buchananella hordeovulneris TaxID=52770 RepID=UPI0026DB1756|nr:hypothetical protein [Buchananella hordeovulneris]MDO5080127.1 hypothetical protein [Buchananella hordeovulneris]
MTLLIFSPFGQLGAHGLVPLRATIFFSFSYFLGVSVGHESAEKHGKHMHLEVLPAHATSPIVGDPPDGFVQLSTLRFFGRGRHPLTPLKNLSDLGLPALSTIDS